MELRVEGCLFVFVCLFDCVCRERPGFRKIRKLAEEVYLILCVMICLLHVMYELYQGDNVKF